MSATSTFETVESATTGADADSGASAESPSGPSTEGSGGLSRDLVFELLSAERRRAILEHLDDGHEETTIGELAEHIAARENGTDPRHLSSTERKRVYIGLYQCHLPKLDDAGVIDYDRARGDVELRPGASALFPYLSLDPSGTAKDDEHGPSAGFCLRRLARAVRARVLAATGLPRDGDGS